ncbi:MAG TPA: hypothetical protein VLB68_04880 [Pyrinomonadaceae bacterium]|nr:hypothetical protein [Pyrinomonadaceae bacterium]
MYSFVRDIIKSVEPIQDTIFGPRYRCSLTLKDGTFLPCAVLQSRERLVELAKRRIKEEMSLKGVIGMPDPYGDIVRSFVSHGNRINDYDVSSASESKYAIPLPLLSQIEGETMMGWTGWVFKMKDGTFFSYGSTFHFEFFQLPEGHAFSDIREVINHSFVDSTGAVRSLKNSGPKEYSIETVFRERVFFDCAVDGI